MEENRGAFEEMKNGAETFTAETAYTEETAKGGKRLKKDGGKRGLAVCAVVLAVVVLYLGLCAWAHFSQRVYPNTRLAGVDYGGLAWEEAERRLEGSIRAGRESTVRFVTADGETVAEVPLGETELSVDTQDIVGTLYYAPRKNGFFGGGAAYLHALLGGMEVSYEQVYREELSAAAKPVLEELEREAVEFDAEVTGDGRVLVTKAKDGRALTEGAEETVVSALCTAYFGGGEPSEVVLEAGEEYEVVFAKNVDLAAAREELVSGKVNASYDIENACIVPSRVGVSFTLGALEEAYEAAEAGTTFTFKAATVEQPEVTTEMLEEGLFRDELSSYTTRVTGEVGRRKNVQLTAERINGFIMNAGETMKYSTLTAPFSEENGYFPAPGYLYGKTVDMIGGGACQASSTLYAAALYADLEIVQRVNHGYASSYIALGLDATVASGGPEFEFRNSTLYPIRVDAEYFTKGGRDYLKVTLCGTKTDDRYVKMISEVLSTTPYGEQIVESDELAPGETREEQTPYTGYLVKTYRNVYAGDGTLISSTYEATSNYKARDRITLVGREVTEPTVPSDPTGVIPSEPSEPSAPDSGAETVVPSEPNTPTEPELPTGNAPEGAGDAAA